MSGDGVTTPLTNTPSGAQPLRAIIYIRVSTPGQSEEAGSTSLDVQLQACRKKAAELGATVIDVVQDIHTGTEVLERPGMRKLTDELVPTLRPDFIIAFHPWRFARTWPVYGYILVVTEPYGVSLRTVHLDQIGSGALQSLMTAMVVGSGQLDNEQRRTSSMANMRARMEAGKYRPGNKPPYGYRFGHDGEGRSQRKTHLIPDEDPTPDGKPATAPVVRRMYAALAGGMKLMALAHELNEEGVPTAAGAQEWTYRHVGQIIERELYRGITHLNTRKAVPVTGPRNPNTTRKPYRDEPRDEAEWIALKEPEKVVPPLVQPDVWAAANAQRTSNRATASRNNPDPTRYLFRGHVVCATCGKPVSCISQSRGRGDTTKRPSYRVAKRGHDHCGCAGRSMTAADLDAQAWRKVRDVLLHPVHVLADYQARIMAVSDDELATSQELTDLDTRCAAIAKKLVRTRALLEDEDDTAEIAVLKERRGELAAQLKAAQTEREAIVNRKAEWVAAREQFNDIEAWLTEAATDVDALDWHGAQERLRKLNVVVRLGTTQDTPRFVVDLAVPKYPRAFTVKRAGDRATPTAQERREKEARWHGPNGVYGGAGMPDWVAAQGGESCVVGGYSTTGCRGSTPSRVAPPHSARIAAR